MARKKVIAVITRVIISHYSTDYLVRLLGMSVIIYIRIISKITQIPSLCVNLLRLYSDSLIITIQQTLFVDSRSSLRLYCPAAHHGNESVARRTLKF